MIRSENRGKRPKFEKFPVKFPVSREFDPETGSPLTGSSATSPIDIASFCESSFASKFVRHVRRLRTLHHNGPVPETQNRGLRRAIARDVSRARFRPVTCRALLLDRRSVRRAQIRGAAAAPANRAAD